MQARILRLLAPFPGATVRVFPLVPRAEVDEPKNLGTDWGNTHSAWYDARRGADLRSLRVPTVLAMAREGWLAEEFEVPTSLIIGPTRRTFALTSKGSLKLLVLEPQDFVSDSKPLDVITVEFMLDSLQDRYDRDNGWTMFREWQPGGGRETHGRRVDAFVFNRFSSRKNERCAFEVKRSRSDFLRELKEPDKSGPAMRFATHFYFVCPTGIVKAGEVPDPSGLIWVNNDGVTRIKKQAKDLPNNQPTWDLVGAMLNVIMRDERRVVFGKDDYQ